MRYTFSTFEIHWPARGSRWTGYRSHDEAARIAADDGVVVERQFTADIPEWRIASLEAEIADGRTVAVLS
jgi:hypothetical protein